MTESDTNPEVEIWKDIPSYDRHEVSTYGRVRFKQNYFFSTKRGQLAVAQTTNRGYQRVTMTNSQGRRIRLSVHRLVATVFLGDPPTPRHQVNHKNNTKSDNRVTNLEWVTPSENQIYSCLHGERKTPKDNPRCRKLTLDQVVEIKQKIALGYATGALAKLFDISVPTISNIKSGYRWGYISAPDV